MPEAVEEFYEEREEERPSRIHDLKRKMRLEGTVTRLELFGAFVDVGVGTDGLVHISQLSTERVNRVSDVVKVGDRVTVWVIAAAPDANRIGLTMIEPPKVDWGDIRSGQVYTGIVKRLERFGAFVDIGATRDGLVHVSEITSDHVEDPSEYVKVADEVQVKVLKVDHAKRRIELSIKALEGHFVVEEDEEALEAEATAMELAWRQARGGPGEHGRQPRRRKSRKRDEDDDIYSRTLRLRSD